MDDPFAAFQMGVGLGAGQSTLGALVRTVVERFNSMQDVQAKYGGELALEQAKGNIQAAQLKNLPSGFVPTKTTVGSTEYTNPALVSQRAQSEAQATETGRLAAIAATPPTPEKQAQIDLRREQQRAVYQKMQKEAKPWYKRLGGTPIPQETPSATSSYNPSDVVDRGVHKVTGQHFVKLRDGRVVPE